MRGVPRTVSVGGWTAVVLSLATLFSATPAQGQEVVAELMAGAAVGNYTDTSAGLDVLPEPGFGFLVEVWPTSSLAAYAGFTRRSFGCEEGFCTDRDASFTSQGLVLGGRWSPGLPWVRAGLAVQSLGMNAEGADDSSDLGLGFELAGGVDIDLGRARLRPGITYMRHGASTSLGDGHVALVALDLGVALSLARF